MTFTGQVQVDFAHDPTSASYTWTDLTSRAQSAQYRRGRSYELGEIQAGSGSLALKNTDGAFDPANGSSPYSPNVLPYKRIQHNVTIGATTYPVFTGLVERWPQEWNAQYGTSPIQVVDMFAWLESITLRSCYEQEALLDAPLAFFPLTELAMSTVASDITGSAIPPLLPVGSGYTFAADTGIPTDSASTLKLTGDTYLISNSFTPVTGLTTEAWFSVDPALVTAMSSLPSTSYAPVVVGSNGILLCYSAGGIYVVVGGAAAGPDLNDGGVHHVVVVAGKTYVDNVLYSGTTAGPSADFLYVGAYPNSGYTTFIGGVGYVACYPSALTAARVAAHYNAAHNAFAGETADARISRLLSYAGWTASASLDACTTTMLGALEINGKTALAAIRDVATSEGGTFFVAKDGTATYTSRRTRMQTTASAVTFGDGTSEVPYLDIAFDFDLTYVYNDIQITRTGAAPASAVNTTSRSHYGQRSYTATFGIQSDTETTDAANWLLNAYLAPHTRIRSVTVDALATTGAWAALLPLEIGSRVTVKRRPFGGATITAAAFVESIAWTITPDIARCTLELSPIPLQALIADDTTYGLCDSTFVAAW